MMNLLFISHDSSYTGAPIVFGHLIRALKENHGIQADILSLNSGPLDAVFSDLGNFIRKNPPRGYLSSKIPQIYRQFTGKKKTPSFFDDWSPAKQYDLIYCNTAVSAKWIPELKTRYGCPVILHIHELELAIEQFCGRDVFERSLPFISQFIAASQAVKTNLTETYGIPDTQISVVYSSIPVRETPVVPATHPAISRWKEENRFIVGGSGTTDWRKGIDLFLYTASLCKAALPEVRFLWIGGHPNSTDFKKAAYEIKKLKLEETVLLIPETPSPLSYFTHFDLFFLSSREDPFPLVCLESGSMGIPVICFEGAGGISELVGKYENCLIPFASIDEAKIKIEWFTKNREKAIMIGQQLKIKIENQFNTDVMSDQVYMILKKWGYHK